MTAPQRHPRDAARAARAAWAARNADKVKAHALARTARRRGDLVPLACEACGGMDGIEGHHTSYAAPLEVTWLCGTCHRAEHVRLRREARAARLSAEALLAAVRSAPEPILLPAEAQAPREAPSPPGVPSQAPQGANGQGVRQ